MSASTSKKNRVNELAAGPTKKQLAAEREAQAKKKAKLTYSIIGAVIAVIVVIVVLFNTGVFYRTTDAVKIDDEGFSPAELQYYLANEYYNFLQSGYASMFGLDSSYGVSYLSMQSCPFMEDGTWADYFKNSAVSQLTQLKALCDYAKENNITLSEEELADIDTNMGYLEQAAAANDVSLKKFIGSYYGGSISVKDVRSCFEREQLASKAYNAYVDSLEYTDAELEEHYASHNGTKDLFSYAYYTVAADKVTSTADDGSTSEAATEETLAAAKETADAIAEAYKNIDVTAFARPEGTSAEALVAAAAEGNAYSDAFSAAVSSVVSGAEATVTRASGASLNSSYSAWLMGDVNEGDVTVVEGSDSYIVVLFLERSDNHYSTVNVRHILVKAEADESGEYSEQAIADAYARAQELLQTWKDGEASEESFAELANAESEDGGSNTNGGLYENVAKGSMVSSFERFCFAGHNSGDTGIVYGNNGSYAGFHVMYFVGENDDLYSNTLAKSDLSGEAVDEWLSTSTEALTVKTTVFAKLAG